MSEARFRSYTRLWFNKRVKTRDAGNTFRGGEYFPQISSAGGGVESTILASGGFDCKISGAGNQGAEFQGAVLENFCNFSENLFLIAPAAIFICFLFDSDEVLH